MHGRCGPITAFMSLLTVIALLAVLLLPLAIVAWLRVRALRADTADAAPAWFSFAHTTGWVVLGGWFSWMAALQLLGVYRSLGAAVREPTAFVAALMTMLLVPEGLLN